MARRTNPNASYEKLKEAAAKARLPFEREWWLNLSFYLDEQYVEWHDASNSVRRIPRNKRTPDAPRPVVNKIMHFVQQELASILQDAPIPDVLPETDDYLAQSDSSVAKAYLQMVAEPTQTNFDKQLNTATLWAIICGEGFKKWVWDPRAKKQVLLPCSPFEIYVDPYAKDFYKARYIIHSQWMDVEQVYENWGKEIKPGSVEQADPMRSELLRGMGATPVLSGVTVNELWMKPCRRYPDGLYVVWAGTDQLVPPTKFPYEHKQLPFTQIGSIERPDSQHYLAPVKYLRSAQMELNKVHAQEIASRQAFSNHKWWIPSELELDQLPDDSPNQILRGQSQGGMLEPKILQAAPLPQSGHAEMIEQQMMHIVGIHEVSQGQVPGRVEAAKAIELLKESDTDRQQTTIRSIDQSITIGGYMQLMLARQFETETVMVQSYSREAVPEIKHFKAGRLSPGTRIRVTRTTGLARTRAQRQDMVLRMWDSKMIQDPDVAAELMEVPVPSFVDPKAFDKRLATNENLVMQQGKAITPNSWDDHTIHLAEHNAFRKTQEYLTLDEDRKQRLEFHCTEHEKLQIAQLVKDTKLALLAQGGVPGGAGGGDSATPPDSGSTVPA